MCYELQQVLIMVGLAVTSGADWEGIARQTVAQKLGVKSKKQPSHPPKSGEKQDKGRRSRGRR